jgi:hypothetical protein
MRLRFLGSLAALRGTSGLPHAMTTVTAASCSGIIRTLTRCEVSKPQFNGSPFRARLVLRSNCYMETNMLRIRFPSRRSFAALKKVSGAHIKVGLIAAVLFALAYAVETRAILVLESSPNPLEVSADHGQNMYQ